MTIIDYTTPALVREALHIGTSGDAVLLARLAKAASRATDKLGAGSSNPAHSPDGYFQQADVVDEVLRATMDAQGNIYCYPRKHGIRTVSALSFRNDPRQSWQPVTDLTLVEIQGPYTLYVYAGVPAAGFGFFNSFSFASRPSNLRVKVSYNGGLAVTQDLLPADFVELVNLLAGRIYREDESGLTDAIGIATVGSVQYTKALPERYKELVKIYQRKVIYD